MFYSDAINLLLWSPKIICKKVYTYIGVLCLTLIATNLPAQTSLPLHLESLTINNGLSQGFISGIIQDKRGLMWFATSDGLNKYDGYTFSVYHHDPDDTTSIGSDDLSCLFEDSKGRFWVGTRQNGIDLFDFENNTFTHILHTNANSLRSDNILGITEDKTGALWIRTNQGIDRMEIAKTAGTNSDNLNFFSSNKLLVRHINLDSEFEKDKYKPANLFISSRNEVLVTTNTKILEVVFNGKSNSYDLKLRCKFPVVDSNHIASLTEDSVNRCFILNNREILKFPNYSFSSFKRIYRFSNLTPWTIDKSQRLWIHDDDKIVRIQIQSGEIKNTLLTEQELVSAINASSLYYTDRSGVVWFGTGGYGILKYDPEKERFHHILPQIHFYQLLEGSPGEIYTNNLYAIAIKNNLPVLVNRFGDSALLKKKFPMQKWSHLQKIQREIAGLRGILRLLSTLSVQKISQWLRCLLQMFLPCRFLFLPIKKITFGWATICTSSGTIPLRESLPDFNILII